MIKQFRAVIPSDKVKIVSINTWKCDGNYAVRMRLLAEQLKNLKPDIIACQECFYCEDAGADTLKFLAEQLKMNYSFLPGRFKKRNFEGKWVDSFSGLGILSMYPINNISQIDLPAVPEDNDRKAQQVKITLHSGLKILVTNTHLTHLNNTDLRKTQAQVLAEFIAINKSYPCHIICGDFNALIDSVEIKTLISFSGVTDCYEAGGGPEPRYSLADEFNRGRKICVDHIFALTNANNPSKFVESGIVLNIPDELTGLYPSDHFGVTTTVIF